MLSGSVPSFRFPSEMSRHILRRIPCTRGYSIVGSWIFRIFPLDPRVVMQFGCKSFTLDLRYRSQFAIVSRGGTELSETAFVASHLRPGNVFFDLGSNWGYYTILAATLVGERGKVISVEMNRDPFLRLLQQVHSASLLNVLAFNYALSSTSGEHVMINKPWYRNDTGGYATHVESPRFHGAGSIVITKTIDQLWRQIGAPDVQMAKLDVEGYELNVIQGGRSFFSEAVKDFVLVEVSGWTNSRSGLDYAGIFRELQKMGFRKAYLFSRPNSSSCPNLDFGARDSVFQSSITLVPIDLESDLLPTGNVLFAKRDVEI